MATAIFAVVASVAAMGAGAAVTHAQRTSTPHLAMRSVAAVDDTSGPERHHGSVGVSVPPVLFGPNDGLPEKLSRDMSYDATVSVLAAVGTGGGTARIGHGPEITLTPGQVVSITAHTQGVAVLHVRAVVDGKHYTRTYHHSVNDG